MAPCVPLNQSSKLGCFGGCFGFGVRVPADLLSGRKVGAQDVKVAQNLHLKLLKLGLHLLRRGLVQVGHELGSEAGHITAKGAVDVGHQGKHLLLPMRVDLLYRLRMISAGCNSLSMLKNVYSARVKCGLSTLFWGIQTFVSPPFSSLSLPSPLSLPFLSLFPPLSLPLLIYLSRTLPLSFYLALHPFLSIFLFITLMCLNKTCALRYDVTYVYDDVTYVYDDVT